MVGDPFEGLRDEDQVQVAVDGFRVVLGHLDEFPEVGLVEGIDFLVLLQHRVGLFRFLMDEALQGIAQHLPGLFGHFGNIQQFAGEAAFEQQLAGALGDVAGLVADALDIVAGLDGDRDEPQVVCQGRAQGEVARGLTVDFHLKCVDFIIPLDDGNGQVDVLFLQGPGALQDGVVGLFTHQHQVGFQGLEFAVEESLHNLKKWEPWLLVSTISRTGR